MKTTIDGKTYNTKTALKLVAYDNGLYTTDFDYCSEDLYLRPKGGYFLHGEGGASSCYSKKSQLNCTVGSESIRLLTTDDAKEWVKNHCEALIYEWIFEQTKEGSQI